MYRGRGFSTRGGGQKNNDFTPRKSQGISLVESVSLRNVQSTTSSGLKVVNNSPGGGQQFNVIAKVPNLETTWAGAIDNPESWMALYGMVPRGSLSVIVAVTPNASGSSTSSSVLDWSVLQHKEEPPSPQVDEGENVDDDQKGSEDGSAVIGDDPDVPKDNNTPPSSESILYEDLVGLEI